MSYLELKGVSKTIGDRKILEEINIAINKGEIAAVIGPPGSGKTTLLKIIAGLMVPTTGRIYLEGKDITDLQPHERGFSMVFEIPPIYPDRTGYENIAFPLRLKKMSEDEIRKRVLSIADLLGIKHILDRKPSTYSGGEYQRVALARALVTEPRLLLLDEPFKSLDAKIREAMMSWMKELHRKIKVSIIYSTHDPLEGLSIGDKILVLLKGVQKQFATSIELLTKPVDLDVDEFISIPALNILRGVIDRCDENSTVITANNMKLMIPKRLVECRQSEEIYVAIRPQDIKLHLTESTGTTRGIVININYMGRNQLVSIDIEGVVIRAVVEKDFKINISDKIFVTLDPSKVRLYDIKTKRLLI
jgi:ABC-type sugar transport system ATPase subunit